MGRSEGGGGRVRVRRVGPGAVLFSCFLFAASWAPSAGARPPPVPWRKPDRKREAAISAESGGLGAELERVNQFNFKLMLYFKNIFGLTTWVS